MTEIFITDIQTKTQADYILSQLKAENTELKANYDLNETGLAYPCGHTIFRVEGATVNTKKVMSSIRNLKVNIEILEDKICKK
ncbi:hypothetical protein [Lacihabitans sp. CS3-21]|uniref:hypothetical protein n=1 Tax=Lacihabitans sp. CS3-21 TaxID=2487332 RepID=UPI0020CFAE52|nr:hypothetical protein [Lacihabitans sp. CS3-21]MCP9746049.1 hypothetical protein [Lacihabitans sp. CS3-21]